MLLKLINFIYKSSKLFCCYLYGINRKIILNKLHVIFYDSIVHKKVMVNYIISVFKQIFTLKNNINYELIIIIYNNFLL
jgi:hypothetical protein